MTSLLLSNRATPLSYTSGVLPTRIHIVPRGELFNQEANVTQVLDDKAIDSILTDLRDKAKAGGLYLGEEHFIYDAGKSSEAFAWGKQFGADEHGIWVENPDYTDVGSAAIKNKRFKWTSFVADPAQAGAIEKIAPDKFRILKIDTVGFTNFANAKSLLTPISNRLVPRNAAVPSRSDGDCQLTQPVNPGHPSALPHAAAEDSRAPRQFPLTRHTTRDTNLAAPSGSARNQNQRTDTMKSIAMKLGLDAEAGHEAILDEVTKLQNRADTAEKQVTTLATERDQIKNRCTSLESEICESLLDACGLKSEDRRRPHLVSSIKPLLNREARITHLADFGLKPEGKGQKPEAGNIRILNRADGKTPTTPGDSSDEQALATKAVKIKNRANELVASGTPFERAWTQATTELNRQ